MEPESDIDGGRLMEAEGGRYAHIDSDVHFEDRHWAGSNSLTFRSTSDDLQQLTRRGE